MADVTVTQADRERAAVVVYDCLKGSMSWFHSEPTRDRILAGAWDRHPTVQAFAAHRMAAERAVVEWQPIETAPRDGTAILAYGEHLPTYFYAIIFERGEWKYCSQGKGWAAPPGMPTHWMPLPAPPTP